MARERVPFRPFAGPPLSPQRSDAVVPRALASSRWSAGDRELGRIGNCHVAVTAAPSTDVQTWCVGAQLYHARQDSRHRGLPREMAAGAHHAAPDPRGGDRDRGRRGGRGIRRLHHVSPGAAPIAPRLRRRRLLDADGLRRHAGPDARIGAPVVAPRTPRIRDHARTGRRAGGVARPRRHGAGSRLAHRIVAQRHERLLARPLLGLSRHTRPRLAPPSRRPGNLAAGQRDLGTTPETKFYFAHLPATNALNEVVRLAHQRWAIEQQYAELKDELGLEHFEGRLYHGWHRHAVLTAIAYAFLQRQRFRHRRHTLTLPQARAVITDILTAHYFLTHRRHLNMLLTLRH